MIAAFTGTRQGCTEAQQISLRALLTQLRDQEQLATLHHGLCVGADEVAHLISRELGLTIVGWPARGVNPRHVAHLGAECHLVKTPHPPLVRNRLMVNVSDVLIACPRSAEEELRSGTWATLRYARRRGRRIYRVHPNGGLHRES